MKCDLRDFAYLTDLDVHLLQIKSIAAKIFTLQRLINYIPFTSLNIHTVKKSFKEKLQILICVFYVTCQFLCKMSPSRFFRNVIQRDLNNMQSSGYIKPT